MIVWSVVGQGFHKHAAPHTSICILKEYSLGAVPTEMLHPEWGILHECSLRVVVRRSWFTNLIHIGN